MNWGARGAAKYSNSLLPLIRPVGHLLPIAKGNGEKGDLAQALRPALPDAFFDQQGGGGGLFS